MIKKHIYGALLAGVLVITACGSDDDDSGGSNSSCYECEIISVTSTYCDIGNGMFSVTTDGITEEHTLGTLSFSQHISNIKLKGTCTKQ